MKGSATSLPAWRWKSAVTCDHFLKFTTSFVYKNVHIKSFYTPSSRKISTAFWLSSPNGSPSLSQCCFLLLNPFQEDLQMNGCRFSRRIVSLRAHYCQRETSHRVHRITREKATTLSSLLHWVGNKVHRNVIVLHPGAPEYRQVVFAVLGRTDIVCRGRMRRLSTCERSAGWQHNTTCRDWCCSWMGLKSTALVFVCFSQTVKLIISYWCTV